MRRPLESLLDETPAKVNVKYRLYVQQVFKVKAKGQIADLSPLAAADGFVQF